MIERKTFAFEFKATDAGIVAGYASTFNSVDLGNDTILPGAFKASLADHSANGRRVKMLWSHDQRQPIGVWDRLTEDSKGLQAEGHLTLKVARAQEVLALMRDGAVDGLSIGYSADDWERRKDGVRVLKKIGLVEVSPVVFPMDTHARISGIKQDKRILEAELRDVIGLSQRDAKKLLAGGYAALCERDVPESDLTDIAGALKGASADLKILFQEQSNGRHY